VFEVLFQIGFQGGVRLESGVGVGQPLVFEGPDDEFADALDDREVAVVQRPLDVGDPLLLKLTQTLALVVLVRVLRYLQHDVECLLRETGLALVQEAEELVEERVAHLDHEALEFGGQVVCVRLLQQHLDHVGEVLQDLDVVLEEVHELLHLAEQLTLVVQDLELLVLRVQNEYLGHETQERVGDFVQLVGADLARQPPAQPQVLELAFLLEFAVEDQDVAGHLQTERGDGVHLVQQVLLLRDQAVLQERVDLLEVVVAGVVHQGEDDVVQDLERHQLVVQLRGCVGHDELVEDRQQVFADRLDQHDDHLDVGRDALHD